MFSDDDYDDYEEPEDDEDAFDCGWSPGVGGCSLVGSEDCEFECPYRDQMEAQLRRLCPGG